MTYSDRFSTFVQRLHESGPSTCEIASKQAFARHLTELMVHILPTLLDVLDEPALMGLLPSVLAMLVDLKVPILQALAAPLGEKQKILQILFANESSSKAMKAWITNASQLFPRSPAVLEAWASTLVYMADHCLLESHDIAKELSRFRSLKILTQDLIVYDRGAEASFLNNLLSLWECEC